MEFIFSCPDACFDVFEIALLGLKLGLGSGPVEALIYLKVRETVCACSWIPLLKVLRPVAPGAFWGFLGAFLALPG